ncbi:hypothetical protein HOR55_gp42 [Ralstonia phage RS-PII-1]|uniref:DUF8033 domain-containing protein n=1 Tax=Ralstonia phage RS-PII-1 TaxID=1932892 RepID=A0A1L7DQD1_9CAUD|nr:hypothetical protein HOR55_gp42 [Ralstonia phage RS-PII-1]APU00329.1 hypothetical protein [Ralstonia phage RS-PII-1]
MKLKSLGSKPEIKIAELTLDDGTKFLFSYGQSVAAFVPSKGFMRVDTYLSKTTERHIETWVDSLFGAKRVSQADLDNLVRSCVPGN